MRCNRILLVLIFCSADVSACGKGLETKNPGTRLAYIARDGKPLLAFGCHLEHMFLADSRSDYTVWSDWAQAHGIPKYFGTLRTKYTELQPGKKPLIDLDAEHFAKAGQRDWNFRNPAFDLAILGNSRWSDKRPRSMAVRQR